MWVLGSFLTVKTLVDFNAVLEGKKIGTVQKIFPSSGKSRSEGRATEMIKGLEYLSCESEGAGLVQPQEEKV